VFTARTDDDILFVMSDRTGFGYFRNFGETRRAGVELGAHRRLGRVTFGAGYTLLSATYQSADTLNGAGNSTNDAAQRRRPGLDGSIDIEPGDRMPLVPRHLFKAYGDVRVTSRLLVDADVLAASSAYARGNENNRHEPDGVYYLGSGSVPGYVVANVSASFRLTRHWDLMAQVNNVFDRRYYTAAQLGPFGFTPTGAFIARPLPAVADEFPVRQATFYAPGAPIRMSIGARLHL
jgi:outer membrane receptor protein involved in Fe transport